MAKRPAITIARTRKEAREWRASVRGLGKRVAFVPTMGALHAGHLSLVKLGLDRADVAGASIFINPAQFSASEDFSTYPRADPHDLDLLAAAGCSFVYCPAPIEIYPAGDSTKVLVKDLSHLLEGEVRPHFFEGVASVVARLFAQLSPDVAVFGEKDYQQLLVVRRMVQDLGFPLDVVGAPIVREADGLAMSSRNAHLTPQEREKASDVYIVMTETAAELEAGASIRSATQAARERLLRRGYADVDYVEARRADTLAPFGTESAPLGVGGRVLIAARLGATRLIDNMAFVRR